MITRALLTSLVVAVAALALPAIASAQTNAPTAPACVAPPPTVSPPPAARDGERAPEYAPLPPVAVSSPAATPEAANHGSRTAVGATFVTLGAASIVVGLVAGVATLLVGVGRVLVGGSGGDGSVGAGVTAWFSVAGAGVISLITGVAVLATPPATGPSAAPQVGFAVYPRSGGAEVGLGVRF